MSTPRHEGDQTEQLFKCFGGDGRGNSYQLWQILGGADRMETCHSQLRLRIWDSGYQEGIPKHRYCGLCPNCVYLKMGQFI